LITCPVLRHLNGRNLRVSGEEPELPEPVKDLVRYPHGDAVAAFRPVRYDLVTRYDAAGA
jgi:hypothetical protein